MFPSPFSAIPAIHTREGCFVDPQGRQVILRGQNVVNKHKNAMGQYFINEGSQSFFAMRRWGMNCVRLGVIWDALEPQPGQFDEKYLRHLKQRVESAAAGGLYVILDMHQDLYSVCFSDGAPEWATITNGAPHITLSPVWSDAYFTSPAVQAALDAFWQNAPAPDGLGLQDHYARAWQVVAKYLADEPVVIGYDLMNEPFPGSAAVESQALMFAKGAELLAARQGAGGAETGAAESPVISVEELMEQWLDPAGRFQILQQLRDVDLYAQVVDATYPLYAAFEQEKLMPMYRRVAAAIRAVDPLRILFLETSMGSNMGVYSAIEPLTLPDGTRDPQQAYAPHGYDLLVDTTSIAQSSAERVALIFARHAETARRLEMPMLVGEWGAFGDTPGTLPAAWDVSRCFERALCSDTYWHHAFRLDRQPAFGAISRPYPERIAGQLESYHFDPQTGVFDCAWMEDPAITAPSKIFLPGGLKKRFSSIQLEPPGSGYQVETAHEWFALQVAPCGKALHRHLTVKSDILAS